MSSQSQAMSGPIPDPPVFSTRGAKFTVPPYFEYRHAETQWLVNMVRANSWDRIWRVAISNPSYFSQTYVQFPDCPENGCGDPMFHRRAVLYLTPLGLAIYMNRHMLVRRILEFRTDDGARLAKPNQLLYAANVYEKDPHCSDLHVIFPFCILFRREAFECIRYLLSAGWNAHEGFVLPYRRAYRMFSFEYKDFLDYSVAQMSARPNLRLPNLIYNMLVAASCNFSVMEFEKVTCSYHNDDEFEDWVSIPRRMLRFMFYFDRDMRLACQLIRCIKVMQKYFFFNGPCRSALDIDYEMRKRKPSPNNKLDMVLFDQDCCISLMLGIFYRAIGLRHNQTQEKLLEVIIDVLVHSHWICHFLAGLPEKLIDMFSSLIENVHPLKLYIIEIIRRHAVSRIANNHYHKHDLLELDVKNPIKLDWEKAIDRFSAQFKDKLGQNESESNNQNASNNAKISVECGAKNSTDFKISTPYIFV